MSAIYIIDPAGEFRSSRDFSSLFEKVVIVDYVSGESFSEFIKKENCDCPVIMGLPEQSERIIRIMTETDVCAGIAVSPDFDHEIKYRLSRIENPLLIINGYEDQERFLRSGRMYHDYIENSTLKVMRKCGHFPHRDRKESFFLTLKRFLEDVL